MDAANVDGGRRRCAPTRPPHTGQAAARGADPAWHDWQAAAGRDPDQFGSPSTDPCQNSCCRAGTLVTCRCLTISLA
jgi:hypothetical protein